LSSQHLIKMRSITLSYKSKNHTENPHSNAAA
jgi:hypothetical protein